MTFEAVQGIADAILFEGYILYPYRPSAIKNRKRWNFGTLWPREFAEAQQPKESCSFHAEMLIEPGADCALALRLRFLRLAGADSPDPQAWEQGVVRSATIEDIHLTEIESARTIRLSLDRPSPEECAAASAPIPEYVVSLGLKAELLREKLYRLQITLANETLLREESAIAQSLAFTSAHLLIHVRNGGFISLLEAPPQFSAFANSCSNHGVFPVLVGDPGDRTMMLCSPIILYDYPTVAPESVANFCDATEMDEMLALRVMTLTDAEKNEMRAADPRSRSILESIEAVPEEYLQKLHGVIRGLQPSVLSPVISPLAEDPANDVQPWNPFEENAALESVNVFGIGLHKGDRVRVWPQKRADILDMTVEGKLATIEAIEQDLDDQIQFAVVFDDDPGKDMGMLRQAGHRFFFAPDEIEPVARGSS